MIRTTLFATALFISLVMFSSTVSADITTGLVGHWKFDEGSGTTAIDSSGSGNTGTLTNGPLWSAGKIGQAVSLDGVDDYIDINNSSSINITGSMSISAWVLGRAFSGNSMIFSKYSGNGHYFDTYNADLQWWVAGTGHTSSGNALSTDVWYHVTGTYDGALVKLYKNGIEIYSATETDALTNDANRAAIGEYSSGGGLRWNGLIDDLRIYNRALTPQEIKRLYNMGR